MRTMTVETRKGKIKRVVTIITNEDYEKNEMIAGVLSLGKDNKLERRMIPCTEINGIYLEEEGGEA